MPDVDECNRNALEQRRKIRVYSFVIGNLLSFKRTLTGIEAKDSDAGKRRDDTGEESEEVRQRGDGDGHCSVAETQPHAFRDAELYIKKMKDGLKNPLLITIRP